MELNEKKKGDIGKRFLQEYTMRVYPKMKSRILEYADEMGNVGRIPEEAMKEFAELAVLGKGIRGALIELMYKGCRGSELGAIEDLSQFIEVFHAGILVQDDVMDKASHRRGKPSIHESFRQKAGTIINNQLDPLHYGEAIANCVGDISFYISWDILLKSSFPSQVKLEIAALYSFYTTRLVAGQMLDNSVTGAHEFQVDDALNVITTKTMEYTSLMPMKIGAMCAGCRDKAVFEALEHYAKCFGWAFQIQDDILGVFGDELEVGKPVGSDICEGKNTLFMIHLEQNGSTEQIAYKNSLIGKPELTRDELIKIRSIFLDAGSFEYVQKLGYSYVEEGLSYIPAITDNKECQEVLESLLVYMMERMK